VKKLLNAIGQSDRSNTTIVWLSGRLSSVVKDRRILIDTNLGFRGVPSSLYYFQGSSL
jgi:hypothetical protein